MIAPYCKFSKIIYLWIPNLQLMALTEHYYTKFEYNKYYHIYNRSVDKKPMFVSRDNYQYFIRKFDYYLSPVLEVVAYCLLGNHFHFLIKIRSEDEIRTNLLFGLENELTQPDLTTFQKLSNLPINTHNTVSHQFKKFFQCYTMAFNKQQERVGTLFQTPFKRALIDKENHFINLIHYIARNPQHHGLVDDFRLWEWCSYNRLVLEAKTKLRHDDVIALFGSKEAFIDHCNGDLCDNLGEMVLIE